LLALAVTVVAIWARGASLANLGGAGALTASGWYGILQAGGPGVFAFARDAPIAPLGEEGRDPGRTLPHAIALALRLAVLVYAVVGVSVLAGLGPGALAGATAPLAGAAGPAAWVARVGAVLASLGALLALVAGVGRTGLAMARNGDLPH